MIIFIFILQFDAQHLKDELANNINRQIPGQYLSVRVFINSLIHGTVYLKKIYVNSIV